MANDFLIVVDDFVVPAATDPNKCRVFGFFKDVAGAPLRNIEFHLQNRYIPQIVGDVPIQDGIIGQKVIVRTDSNGLVEFDLYRKAQVDIMVPSQNPRPFTPFEDNPLFHVVVPDVASIQLIDLLHPVPDTLEFLVTSPVILALDASVVVKVKLIATNLEVQTKLDSTLFESDDAPKVAVEKSGLDEDGDLTITLRRDAVGTAFITAKTNRDLVHIEHRPARNLKLIVNAVEDANGLEVS